jgi:hypothetical protein
MRHVLSVLVFASLASLARSQCNLDQNQPNSPSYMAAFSQTNLAQSFRTAQDHVCGAGILLRSGVGTSDIVSISLWTNLPNAGGVMLAQASAVGTQGTWCDVFWPAVGILPNTTYYLVFDGNTTLGISGDTSNPYPNGQVYANAGYGPFPTFDYTFRTHAAAGPMCPLDQNQPGTSVGMAAFSQTDLAQSFSTPRNSICGAGISLIPGWGTSDTVTISLWSNLPNAGGTLMAQGTTLGTQGTWCDVGWPTVPIVPNATYYLVFTGNTTLAISGEVTDPYPNGQVYANAGYGSFPSFDYSFRTFSPTGACSIDQNQPSATVYMAGFGQTNLAQSFSTPQSSVCGAGIKLQAGIGTSDMVTIQLWNGLPNAGGTRLAQGTAPGTQGAWVDVSWPPMPVTPNATYYLVFTGNTSLGISGDISNPYPNGQVYANPGYGPFPSFDYTFRTYSGQALCPPPVVYCTAGTTTNGCNASIASTGTPSIASSSGFVLSVATVEGQKTGILFYGINNTGFTPSPWGAGTSFLCVKAPTQRTPVQVSGGTAGLCNGTFVLDWLAYMTANPAALGQPISVGQQFYGQAWFRDPPAPKTTNLSNALNWTVCP